MPFVRRVARGGARLARSVSACVLLLAVLAPACAPRPAPAPASPTRTKGGELRLAQEAPSSLDPIDVDSVYESLPVNQIFDGLVDTDGSLRIVPNLAQTWTASRDGRTYTFRLREGVRFHDGSLLTADDVVFTFQRLLAPENGRQNVACAYLDVVRGASDYSSGRRRDLPGVLADDPRTVRIVLDRPYPSFLEVLAMDGLRVVPRAAVARGREEFRRSPVGTGPFRLVSWSPERLRLGANTGYFRGAPSLDAVTIAFLDPSERDRGAARFRRGELDLLEAPAGEVEALSGDPRVHLFRYPEMSLTFLGLATTDPSLRDPRVRQAITHALNRENLGPAMGNVYRPASGILPPGLTGYLPGAKALAHDAELARRLLAEAGHPRGAGLPPLDVYASTGSDTARSVFAGIAADLAGVGIEARLREVTWREFTRRLNARTAPSFLLTWVADLTDPDAFLRTLFQSGGPANLFGFSDEETDRLLGLGALERDPVARSRIYARAEQRLLGLAPIVPLYHTIRVLALRPGVHGLEPGPLGLANVGFEDVWIEHPEDPS